MTHKMWHASQIGEVHFHTVLPPVRLDLLIYDSLDQNVSNQPGLLAEFWLWIGFEISLRIYICKCEVHAWSVSSEQWTVLTTQKRL